ncbi:MAG: antibiotic biosynthesis monooxygenase [Alphaproteobacteria bacterium]|nr:antibiotic biosynthesis monooxygenase [Alphaproteobacteria bacterium]
MSQSSLTLFATIKSKQGNETALKESLQKLIIPTLKEKGCLEYRLLQDKEDLSEFILVEKWADEDSWKAHMEMPHLKAFLLKMDSLVENFKGKSFNEIQELA